MAAHEVTLQINVEGLEQAKAAFREMGEEAKKSTDMITTSSERSSNILNSATHRMAWGFRSVAYSINTLNRDILGNIPILQQFTTAFMTVSIIVRLAEGINAMSVAMTGLKITTHAATLAEWAHNLALKEKLVVFAGTAAGYAMYYGQLIASTIAEWAHIIALKAKAVALAITHALSGPAGWAILAGAVATAAVGLALTARIPEGAGVYTKASPLKFITGPLAGTTVNEGASINITIYGAGSPRETGDAVVDALRRAGVV